MGVMRIVRYSGVSFAKARGFADLCPILTVMHFYTVSNSVANKLAIGISPQ